MKMKNRSHRYDINRRSSRQGNKSSKYKKCLSMMLLIMCQYVAQFMKKLSNTETELKKSLLIKKRIVHHWRRWPVNIFMYFFGEMLKVLWVYTFFI